MGRVVSGIGNVVGGAARGIGNAAQAVGGAVNGAARRVGLNGGNILGALTMGPGGFVLGGAAQDATDGSGRGIGQSLLNNFGRGAGVAAAGLGGAALGGLAGAGGGLGGLSMPSLGGLGGALGNAGQFLGSPLGQGLAGIAGGVAGGVGGANGIFDPNISATQNAATGTAGNYANFLNQMMGFGPPQAGGARNALNQIRNPGQTGPAGGQMNAQNALQNMLSGRPGDPSSLQDYFGAGMGGNGQADLSPINVGYTPQNFNQQAPSFTGANLQQAQNFDPMQVAAMQQAYQNPNLQSIGLQNIGREMMATGPNTMQGFGGQAQLSNIINPQANQEALAAIMGGQQQRDIADLRERFGNQALSSGAMQAEGLYRAEAMPRQAMALDEIMRQNQAQQLTQRGQDLMAWQTGRGMDIQQLGLGADQANQLNEALLAQRGQDIQQAGTGAQIGLQGNDQQLTAAEMANRFGLQGGQLNLQAQMANQGAGLQAAGLNNDALMNFNQQNLQLGGQQNQFDQQNFMNLLQQMQMGDQSNQFLANLGLQQGQLNQQGALQNQQLGNQWNMGLQNVGMGLQGQQAQAQQAALAQLFGGWNNMAQIGLPQAENVVGPSTGSNIASGIGAAGDIMGMINGLRGLSGGGSPANYSNPALQNLPPMSLPPVSQIPNSGAGGLQMMPQIMNGPQLQQGPQSPAQNGPINNQQIQQLMMMMGNRNPFGYGRM